MKNKVLVLFVVVLLLAACPIPAFAQENPFGTIDPSQMASAMASFIGYFQGAIAVIVGVFAAVIVVRGIKGAMGGGG